MSITTVGNQLIHYEALGRGSPLIFLHGWFGSWRYWWGSMQALSTHFRTFAVDLWGFGDSSKTPDRYSLDGNVLLLDQFISRLGISGPVMLVGHSLGAAVALRYASEHPDTVSRVTTVALPLRAEYINEQLTQGDAELAAGRFLTNARQFPELEAELHKTDPLAFTKLTDSSVMEASASALKQVSCPVLLVFGEEDPLIHVPNGHFAEYQSPEKQRVMVTLKSCTHFPMLEQAATFNRLILDFARAEDNLAELAPKEYWQRRTF
jgi:pimeloyl-ACP methyl ester carboxylesterase